jgi:hypothetical protein
MFGNASLLSAGTMTSTTNDNEPSHPSNAPPPLAPPASGRTRTMTFSPTAKVVGRIYDAVDTVMAAERGPL